MDQFEAARLKYEKNRKQQGRELPSTAIPEKKPEPKPVRKEPEPMVMTITGLPFEMTLIVDYQGTLTSGQVDEKYLKAMFKKCLLPIGRVR